MSEISDLNPPEMLRQHLGMDFQIGLPYLRPISIPEKPLIHLILATKINRSHLKKVFWPPAFIGGIGRSVKILKILEYSSGLNLAAALPVLRSLQAKKGY